MEKLSDYTVTDLPPCVLLHIFSFLDPEDILSMRKINQPCHHVSYNSSLWKTLDSKKCSDSFITDGSFWTLLHEVENVIECLHFDIRFTAILDHLIDREDFYCPNLREIYIYNDMMLGEFEDISSTLGLNEKMLKLSKKYTDLKTLVYDNLYINTDAVFSSLDKFECWCNGYTVDRSLEEPTQLKKFLKKHPQIQQLRLELLYCNNENFFTSLFTDFPGLKSLSVCGLISEELNPLLQNTYHLSQLQELSIYDLPEIQDGTLQIILRNACNLKTFRAWYCHRLTDATLTCLANYCNKLETFEIGGLDAHYTDVGLLSVSINCTKLKRVQISPNSSLNDLSILSFITNCSALSELEIDEASNLSDGTVLTMVERCPNMQRLDFSYCSCLTSVSISLVFRYYKNLDYLKITNNKTLTSLDLMEIKPDEEANRKNLVETERDSDVNGNAHEQNKVNMNEQKEKGDETEETDNTNNGENIEDVVSTSSCKAVLPEAQILKCTQSAERWSALETLDMSGCLEVTDSCLYSIVCYCSNLRELNLSGCKNLTNTTVSKLVERCKFLKVLDISVEENISAVEDVSKLTDDCLFDIALHGNKLEILKLNYCFKITSQGVFEILNNCSVLRLLHVTVRRNRSLTKDQLIRVSRRIRHRYVCIKEQYDGFFSSVMEIDIYKYKPSFSKRWCYCNFDEEDE